MWYDIRVHVFTTLMPRKQKNPLAIAFGRSLDGLRRKEGLSSEQMAEHLGIGYSTLRGIISGSMPLNPDRIPHLINSCPRSDLQWERVAQILTAISILDSINTNAIILQKTWTKLLGKHTELSMSQNHWSQLAVQRRSTKIDEVVKDAGIVERLQTFLQKPFEEKALQDILNDINPYLLELKVEEFESLEWPLLTPISLSRFERSRTDRIQELFGVVRSLATLEDSLQSSVYKWESFKSKLKGILVLEEHSAQVINRVRRLLLQKVGSAVPIIQNTNAALTEFFNDYHAFQSPSDPKHFLTVPMNNLWLYKLTNPTNTVAIIDNLKINAAGKEELSFSTSLRRPDVLKVEHSITSELLTYSGNSPIEGSGSLRPPKRFSARVKKVIPANGRPGGRIPACYLGVSLDNPNFTGERLEALLYWVAEHSEKCLIIIGDKLARHTVMCKLNCDEDTARREACAAGDKIEANLKRMTSRYAAGKFSIVRWDFALEHELFEPMQKEIKQSLRSHPRLLDSVQQSARAFVRRLEVHNKLAMPFKTAVFHCCKYVEEEVAAFACLGASGWPIEIYPGPELPILKLIAKEYFSHLPTALRNRVNIEVTIAPVPNSREKARSSNTNERKDSSRVGSRAKNF